MMGRLKRKWFFTRRFTAVGFAVINLVQMLFEVV